MENAENHGIIFFDGVCNLCNWLVQFVIARDPEGYFKFASLQSDEAQPYLKSCHFDASRLDTVVLLENGKCYTQSAAVLKILKKMPGFWPVLSLGMFFPAFFRDGVYAFISRNRYSWFGKQESCWLPTPELKKRFL